MATIFRNKNRSRASASSATSNDGPSPTNLTSSVPYSQIPSSHPPPVAGPSTSTISFGASRREGGLSVHNIGAPNTNPGLVSDGTMFNAHNRRSGSGMPPPSPRKSGRSKDSTSLSAATAGGTGSSRRSTDEGTRRLTAESGTSSQDMALSNGFQQPSPSITLDLDRSSPSIQEFGGKRQPYAAAAADPDNMSIRTVSSANSAHPDLQAAHRDLGRYPSFTDSRASVSSRNSNAMPGPRTALSPYAPSINSASPGFAGSRVSEEFHFPRPDDHGIEEMFQRLLATRDVDARETSLPTVSSRASVSSQINIVNATSSLPIETKWQMLESDARARWEAKKESKRKEDEMVRTGKMKRGTAGVVLKNSPEWFLKKVLDGTLTTHHLSTLSVSIRTQPLE